MSDFPDLSQFEALYHQFDGGHGVDHVTRVRKLAVKLAKKYLPEKVHLAYIAATLHDIGLVHGRKDHELNGAKMARESEQLQQLLSKSELAEVADAIANHRASTGKPKTILAKIISDADKVSDNPGEAMRRAVGYGKKHYPDLSIEEQIWRAAVHLKEKFGPEGTGNRTYFPESSRALQKTYGLIIKAVDSNDHSYLKKITQSE
jgi:uncharacterized protein